MDILISIGTLIILTITVITILTFLFFRKEKNFWLEYIQKMALPLSLILVLASMIGSLYYSEIAHFVPCKLCWFLRIAIYPQIVLILVAIFKKDERVWNYLPWLTGFGILVSLIHNYGYYFGKELPGACDASASCNAYYVSQFGFVTIPLMGLAIVAGLGAIILVKRYYKGTILASK